MRALSAMLVVAILLPAVSAMGLLVPPEFEDTIELDEDELELAITVVNDDTKNRVEFFVRTQETGFLVFDGRDELVSTFTLDPYEERIIEFELEAVRDTNDEILVEYGFMYRPHGSDDDFALEQVVSTFFMVEIDDCCEDLDVEVKPKKSSSSSSSGGSGGGTISSSFFSDDETDSDVVVPDLPDEGSEDSGVSLQDVTGDTTALTVGRADVDSRGLPESLGITGDASAEGKGVALLLLGMLILSLVVQFAALKVYQGGEQ